MSEVPLSATGKTAEQVAREAVALASRTLVRGFRKQKQVYFKGRGNVVTDTDYRAEARVIDHLQREFPDFSILSEEKGAIEGTTDYTWIIDPLDGSRNFASDNPHFAVNLGLAYEGDMLLAFTLDPLRKELFHALKGRGAFLNGAPISVSKQETIAASVLATDMGYDEEMARRGLEMLADIWPGMQTIRIMGSAALGLAWAACGRVDLYFHHALAPWDVMCGLLLLREAGGVITSGSGGPADFNKPSIIATNAQIHAEFLERTEGSAWRGPRHRLAPAQRKVPTAGGFSCCVGQRARDTICPDLTGATLEDSSCPDTSSGLLCLGGCLHIHILPTPDAFLGPDP